MRRQQEKKKFRVSDILAFQPRATAASCSLGFLKVMKAKKRWTYLPVHYTSEMEWRLLLFVLVETISSFPLVFIGDAPRQIFGQGPVKL